MRGEPSIASSGDLLESGDEAFVATFNHSPRSVTPWRKPPATLVNVLAQTRPTGGTAIYDAMVAFSPLFEQRTECPGRDGRGLRRRRHGQRPHAAAGARDPAAERCLRLRDRDRRRPTPGPARASTRTRSAKSLDRVAAIRRSCKTAADLGPATARIADELNKQYTLAYSSSRPAGRHLAQHPCARDARRLSGAVATRLFRRTRSRLS